MRKQHIAALLLGCTASSQAFAWDHASHIELSYQVDCSSDIYNNYCVNSPYELSLTKGSPEQKAKTEDDVSTTLPLHFSVSDGKDWDYLLEQSYTIIGLSVATVGLMTLLPESITKWDAEARDLSNLGKKWTDNVSDGPVWDGDEHFLNYVAHPYFGGVYYTVARHSGFDEFESFLYSFTMSTFFWEFGVEAFAEVPSTQDIIVTPLFGAAVGELMFQTEQEIVAEGGEVMGSKTLGDISLFFLNPVGHIHYWVTDWWGDDTEVNMNYSPWFGNQSAAAYALDAGAPYDSQFIGLEFKLNF